MKNKKRSYFSSIFIAILIYILSFIIALPNFKKDVGRNDPQKACYSNIRIIQGAIEMYNMDNSSMMCDIDIERLIQGKYLKEPRQLPKKECKYLANGNLSEEGQVYCQHHGGMNFDTPESEELYKREASIRYWKKVKEKFTTYVLSAIPSIIYLFFALM